MISRNKTTRTLKIYENSNRTPYLLIKAKWLKDCGFNSGDKIEVVIRKNKLIITNKNGKL